LYRQHIRAWHYSLHLIVKGCVSAFITLLSNDWIDVYQYLNFPSEQVSLMESMPYMSNNSIFMMLWLTLISYLIFYFHVKKYFKKIQD